MALAAGTRLGTYEITGSLGAGGMGEVYRATDTTLKRDVALKVLPDSFAEDTDRVARFRREAEVLASLNHPNIATIHGLENADGQTVIVMEMVEGLTLADRIAEGPIVPDEALAIARQVADALEAAHGARIVHRDLKPANVKLRPDGTVKVLDFGISKPIDAQAISGGRSPVGTTPAMTETGVILGTAAYMSPEQARGKPVDERTDIWAFGCLLFEMLTGQPAFGGEDVMLTLARVLANDTDLDSMPGTISPAVRRTIKLCLEKDPRRRIADIRDVRLAIEGAFETQTDQLAVAGHTKPQRAWSLTAVGFLTGSVLVGLIAWQLWPAPPNDVPMRLHMLPPAGFEPLVSASAAPYPGSVVSPDGSRIVTVGTPDSDAAQGEDVQLWLWTLDSFEAIPLPGTEGGQFPFWSPDGRWIGFLASGALKRVDLSGEPARTVLRPPSDAPLLFAGAWGPDGTLLFTSAEGGLSRVPAAGGEPVTLTTPDAANERHEVPAFLPDGQHFLYFKQTVTDAESNGIRVGSLDAAPDEQPTALLMLADDGPVFVRSPDGVGGYVLFIRDGALLAQRFDTQALTLASDQTIVLAPDVGSRAGPGSRALSASADGRVIVAFPPGTDTMADSGFTLSWVDRGGNVEPFGLARGQYVFPSISPDGTRVLVTIRNSQSPDIGVSEIARPGLSSVAATSAVELFPIWSPDGRDAIFATVSGDGGSLSRVAADGTGQIETLYAAEGFVPVPSSWIDDRTLVYSSIEVPAGRPAGIWQLSLDEREPRPLISGDVGNAAVSPRGDWIAYQSMEESRIQVFIERLPAGGDRRLISTSAGGFDPIWSPDGRVLYYRRFDDRAVMAVAIETEPEVSIGAAERLFDADQYVPASGTPVSQRASHYWAQGPDGRFLMIAVEGTPSTARGLLLLRDRL